MHKLGGAKHNLLVSFYSKTTNRHKAGGPKGVRAQPHAASVRTGPARGYGGATPSHSKHHDARRTTDRTTNDGPDDGRRTGRRTTNRTTNDGPDDGADDGRRTGRWTTDRTTDDGPDDGRRTGRRTTDRTTDDGPDEGEMT